MAGSKGSVLGRIILVPAHVSASSHTCSPCETTAPHPAPSCLFDGHASCQTLGEISETFLKNQVDYITVIVCPQVDYVVHILYLLLLILLSTSQLSGLESCSILTIMST